MFLFIFEDGTIKNRPKINTEDLRACEEGYVDIVDISDPKNPKQFIHGDWVEISNT